MSARALRPGKRRAGERGIALVLALWLTVLLTVIAGTFAFDMHNEAYAARNAVSLAQARALADGAVERTAFELSRPRTPEAWLADGVEHAWSDGDAKVVATAVDETARIDLNAASEALLRSLFVSLGAVDTDKASALIDAIADWKDPDDLKRANGAEDADYVAAGSKYHPSNGPFETVGDLARVLGMTPEIFARVAPVLTVYSRQPGINPQTASRDALMALPNATAEQVDAYIAARSEARAQKLPIPPFPPAQGFTSAAVPLWRIAAAVTMPDGVTFVREAVVSPSADPRRPLIALAWTEGVRAPQNETPAAASAQSPQPGSDVPRS